MGIVTLQIRDPRKAALAKNKIALRRVTPGTADEEHTGELLRAVIIKQGPTALEDEYAVIFKNPDGSGRQFALRLSGQGVGQLIQALCAAQRPALDVPDALALRSLPMNLTIKRRRLSPVLLVLSLALIPAAAFTPACVPPKDAAAPVAQTLSWIQAACLAENAILTIAAPELAAICAIDAALIPLVHDFLSAHKRGIAKAALAPASAASASASSSPPPPAASSAAAPLPTCAPAASSSAAAPAPSAPARTKKKGAH